MVVPAIVNMLLVLSGFLTGLRWKGPIRQQGRHASSNSVKSHRKV